MKALFLVFALFSVKSFATVDGNTSVWLVVQNFNDEEDFLVQQAPMIGCYGISQGPQLAQFTKPYEVASSVGCGWDSQEKNDINALSCAEVVSSEESANYRSISKIVLDISKCEAKNSKKFITMIRTAAARNFPQYSNSGKKLKKEVELIIKK
jgi:hypothetical protein